MTCPPYARLNRRKWDRKWKITTRALCLMSLDDNWRDSRSIGKLVLSGHLGEGVDTIRGDLRDVCEIRELPSVDSSSVR
jgi:hypothetical protein